MVDIYTVLAGSRFFSLEYSMVLLISAVVWFLSGSLRLSVGVDDHVMHHQLNVDGEGREEWKLIWPDGLMV